MHEKLKGYQKKRPLSKEEKEQIKVIDKIKTLYQQWQSFEKSIKTKTEKKQWKSIQEKKQNEMEASKRKTKYFDLINEFEDILPNSFVNSTVQIQINNGTNNFGRGIAVKRGTKTEMTPNVDRTQNNLHLKIKNIKERPLPTDQSKFYWMDETNIQLEDRDTKKVKYTPYYLYAALLISLTISLLLLINLSLQKTKDEL